MPGELSHDNEGCFNPFGDGNEIYLTNGINTMIADAVAPHDQGPLLPTWFNLIPAWISNYIHFTVGNEITYPFSNFNSATVEVWEWISNFIPHISAHSMITYPRWEQS